MEVRREPTSADLQQRLVNETVRAAIAKTADTSEGSVAAFTEAAVAEVKRYARGAKTAGKWENVEARRRR